MANAGDDTDNGVTPARFYDELRALAGFHLAREASGHSFQPTALAHEAYLRLADQVNTSGYGKARLMAIASTMIRRILVDHARHRQTAKRGGNWRQITLEEVSLTAAGMVPIDVLDLDEALQELSVLNPRQARVVELRFFGGFPNIPTGH